MTAPFSNALERYDVLDKFIKNFDKEYAIKNDFKMHSSFALYTAFEFSKTPEGGKYWQEIHDKIQRILCNFDNDMEYLLES